MNSIVLAAILFQSAVGAGAAVTNAWERTDGYVAPDFNAYFPDDTSGGERLTQLERNRALESLPAGELISAVQNGLRTTKSHTLSILRTLGNRLIWGRSPQNPDAIELMYHATGYPDLGSTRHWAVYFGLSVVESKTSNILRTLMELAMVSNDPNLLSRVAWGVHSQRREGLACLEPYLNSEQDAVREKARILQRILNGELDAFAWARDEARKKAETAYRAELPEIKRTLTEGTSEERLRTLAKIFRDGIALIMDDSFIPAFAACAADIDVDVRENVAKIVGENWIWHAKEQSPGAIQLMLQLTRDPDREVRYDAVYHGLSTVRAKNDEVVRRLVEMYLTDNISDVRWRIDWGLHLGQKEVQAKTMAVIAEYLNDADPKVANTAAEWHRSWAQRAAAQAASTTVPNPLGTNSVKVMRILLSEPNFQPFFLRLIDGQVLFIPRRESLALGQNIAVVVEAEDRVRTIDARQIATVEELPALPATK